MILRNEINPNNIKLLIYDVDGTLVRFETLFDLLKESFEIHKIPFKKEYFKDYVLSVSKALKENNNNFSKNSLADSFDKNFSILKDYSVKGIDYLETLLDLEYKYTYMYDDVKITLDKLYNYYPQVISTNWFEISQKVKIDKFSLLRYFERIYSCENFYPKPNQRHFEKISRDYKLLPKECLVIGDSITDVSASNYGFKTLLIDYDSKKEELYDLSSSVITNFKDLNKVLTRRK